MFCRCQNPSSHPSDARASLQIWCNNGLTLAEIQGLLQSQFNIHVDATRVSTWCKFFSLPENIQLDIEDWCKKQYHLHEIQAMLASLHGVEVDVSRVSAWCQLVSSESRSHRKWIRTLQLPKETANQIRDWCNQGRSVEDIKELMDLYFKLKVTLKDAIWLCENLAPHPIPRRIRSQVTPEVGLHLQAWCNNSENSYPAIVNMLSQHFQIDATEKEVAEICRAISPNVVRSARGGVGPRVLAPEVEARLQQWCREGHSVVKIRHLLKKKFGITMAYDKIKKFCKESQK